jgi:probable HAF family extracellular repeat protein
MRSTRLAQAAPATDRASEKSQKYDVIDLGPFDNNRNDILALNDVSQCAGVSLNPQTGRVEAFRQENGIRSMLGTLGGSFSIARGLNNEGVVVGASLTEDDESFHGFLHRDNQLHDLNDFIDAESEWELIQALSINNQGEILAIGSHTGEDRIVKLRPRM